MIKFVNYSSNIVVNSFIINFKHIGVTCVKTQQKTLKNAKLMEKFCFE